MSLFSFIRKKSQAAEPQDSPVPDSSTLDKKLQKPRSTFTHRILNFLHGPGKFDQQRLEDLEDQLLSADIGIDATAHIIDALRAQAGKLTDTSGDAVIKALKAILAALLQPCAVPLQIDTQQSPFVILVIGVNGVGKTTTIAKLANQLQAGGLSVMLGAGDTFRAAAIEQLQTWGERNGVPVIAQQQGADSASVIFDALQSAKARNIDVLIADTAGRLHTQAGLMDELVKVKRVLGKLDPNAPHEVLLVLDGGTGQNVVRQAEEFSRAMQVTGLVITKLDGTAKGGALFSLAKKLPIPVRFIGVGETIEDLRVFDPGDYVDALLGDSSTDSHAP